MQDLASKTDEELVACAQRGDIAATEELMRRYKDAVRRFARKFAFDVLAETDDLAQEGMIGLYSAVGKYDAESGKSFKNFVYTCVIRRIYSYLRFVNRRKPEGMEMVVPFDPDTIPEGENPEEALVVGEANAEFRLRLMKALSDFEFRVVTMYLEGMSYAAISDATGKEIKSIDNALARAKRKLQRVYR